jgi:hypothetical protein
VSLRLIESSLHIWPPEQHFLVGGQMDAFYTKGTDGLRFLEEGFVDEYDTINTHILFGRSGFKLNRVSWDKRLPLVHGVLEKAKRLAKRRIIFSDYHADSKQFKLRHLKPKAVVIDFVEKELAPTFKITEIAYSAGEGCPVRDLHIVADRVP